MLIQPGAWDSSIGLPLSGADVSATTMGSVSAGVSSESLPSDTPRGASAVTSEYVTKDSGQRETMETGSVRDSREGKGRFDLVSPFALARLAGVYERGAKKYSARNWEKGQPYSRFLDSAKRHLEAFHRGWTDEDHLAQAAWNIFAIMHFQELGCEALDDMPHYQSGPKQ
jgi:hypothetical protein